MHASGTTARARRERDAFTQWPRRCRVVRVKTQARQSAALWIALGMIGCGSSAPGAGPAAPPEAGGVVNGSGGSTGVVVTPMDGSLIANESGSAMDAAVGVVSTDADVRDAARTGFVHPGILVNRAQLDFVKSMLGVEPWKTAFTRANGNRLGSLTYAPTPIAVVECGSYSNPDIGCTDEKNDASAAYTQALLFYLTGQEAHAKKAIEIMNGWSAVLKDHTN